MYVYIYIYTVIAHDSPITTSHSTRDWRCTKLRKPDMVMMALHVSRWALATVVLSRLVFVEAAYLGAAGRFRLAMSQNLGTPKYPK